MMKKNILDIWGGGQLLCFSAFDGETDFEHGLVLRSTGAACAFEIKLPEPGGVILFDRNPPDKCFMANDFFEFHTASGTVRGAFVDATHLLIEGPCLALGLANAVRIARKSNRTLVGSRAHFDAALLDVDLNAQMRLRERFLDAVRPPENMPEPALKTFYRAASQLKGQLNSPALPMRHRWTTPDRWPHRKMWLWDSVFHAAALRHFDLQAAKDSLEAVFDSQHADGFIPHCAAPGFASDVTQPPLLAFGAKLLTENEFDRDFIAEVYERNGSFLRWIAEHRDSDGAGLVEWAISGEAFCRSGESGMDNSSRFDGAVQLDAPDFNAYLAQDCEIMADFARKLGRNPAEWEQRHRDLNKLMNQRLWDADKHLYMDFDVSAKKRTDVMSSAGFLPLISGAPSPEMAAELAGHLKNPQTFGTPFRLPSISCSQSEYYSKDMWRGPVWINVNYLVANGLDRYNFHAEADELRRETMREIERAYMRYGTLFEFFDDRMELDPPRLSRKGACDPDRDPLSQPLADYGWTAALYLDLAYGQASAATPAENARNGAI